MPKPDLRSRRRNRTGCSTAPAAPAPAPEPMFPPTSPEFEALPMAQQAAWMTSRAEYLTEMAAREASYVPPSPLESARNRLCAAVQRMVTYDGTPEERTAAAFLWVGGIPSSFDLPGELAAAVWEIRRTVGQADKPSVQALRELGDRDLANLQCEIVRAAQLAADMVERERIASIHEEYAHLSDAAVRDIVQRDHVRRIYHREEHENEMRRIGRAI